MSAVARMQRQRAGLSTLAIEADVVRLSAALAAGGFLSRSYDFGSDGRRVLPLYEAKSQSARADHLGRLPGLAESAAEFSPEVA